jgi:HAMP domain-containing protein
MKIRVSISAAIILFGVTTALGLAAMVITSGYALNQLRIGGALYSQIKLGNDLVADILPPPEYVVESYLEVTLALRDPSKLSVFQNRLKDLHKEYDERRDYWVKAELEPAMKASLTVKSDAEVQKFWAITENEILPALGKNDKEAAEKAYARLGAVYQAHRAIIDGIVKQANAANSELEIVAAQRVSTYSTAVWIVSGVVVLLIAFGIFGIARGVVSPVVRVTAAVSEMAAGNLDIVIPGSGRRDEIGDLAKAIVVSAATPSRRRATKRRPRSSRIRSRPGSARRT